MKKVSVWLVCVLFLSVVPAHATEEAFKNGDFSSVDGHMPTGWSIGYGSAAVPGENICVLENQYNGKNALRLYDPRNTGPAHYGHMTVTQTIKNLIPGAEYIVSGYSKMITKGTSQGGVIKVSVGGKETDITAYYSTLGVWEKQTIRFAVPEDTTTASILVRLVGGGELLWADMQLSCINKYISTLDSDAVFYYTDQTEGTVTLSVNPYFSDELQGSSVLFAVDDAGSALWEQNVALVEGGASASFPLSVLSAEKKAYSLRATLSDADGNPLETQTQTIYRYKRPTMIGQDGVISIGGTEIKPAFAYHVRQKHYEACAAAGINIIQNAMHSTVEGYVDMLDGALDEEGKPMVYMLLPLYNNMLPAGHPANIDLTREVAQSEAIRNHPALFGYLVMDEPFLNMGYPEEHLERAYTTIREYDGEHPVFIMENYPEKYRVSAKYADILGVDIYAGSADEETPVSEFVTKKAAQGRAAAGQKPFWVLLQTFDYQDYFPTAIELRGQIYQASLAGADAVGFYKIEKASGGKDLCDIPALWNMISAFCTDGEYAKLAEKEEFIVFASENGISRRWSDGERQYVQVLNRTMRAQTVEVPLGIIQPGVYEAEVLYGDAESAEVDINRSILRVTLPAAAAATVELTYKDAVFYVIDSETGMAVKEVAGGQTVDVFIKESILGETEDSLQLVTAFYTDGGTQELCGIQFYRKDKETVISLENVKILEDADTMRVYIWRGNMQFSGLLELS